jgi:hypothetical protein
MQGNRYLRLFSGEILSRAMPQAAHKGVARRPLSMAVRRFPQKKYAPHQWKYLAGT